MNTPDKVDKIVEEFTVGLSTGEYVIDEAWLRATLTQYHQDLMREVVEKLEKERKPLVHDVNWAEGHNAGLTKAQTIIKSK